MSHKDMENMRDKRIESDLTKEEDQIVKAISQEWEDAEIPENLKPDRIEAVLSNEKKKTHARYLKYASIAASVVLVFGAILGINRFGGNGKSTESASQESADQAVAKASEDQVAESGLSTAKSYDEVYEAICRMWEQQNSTRDKALEKAMGESVKEDIASEEFSMDSADTGGNMASQATPEMAQVASEAKESGNDYSDTNTREKDVGEADIVKTDGNYLYILNGNRIRIVDIREAKMKESGNISLEPGMQVYELYVKDGRLTVFYSEAEQLETNNDEYGAGYREYTVAQTYDISDPASPKNCGKIRQSGNYDSVRIVDGFMYLFSNYYVGGEIARESTDSYIPCVQGKTLEKDSIYMPKISKGNQFLVVTAFSMEEPDQALDSKAILSAGGACYVSPDNIYIYETVYDDKEAYNQTFIRKIRYEKGTLKGIAQAKIWGYVKDSFCIDEYEGNLRIVTTVEPIANYDDRIVLFDSDSGPDMQTSSNALYVLNDELEVIGKVEELAPEETIYSARFMGDMGYFVTYQQVDPLFSVDLSEPEKPKILGALKIPGFSEYLHPYGDGLLLGIGMDADMAGVTNGVKLSMFDITDPADVREVQKEVLEQIYSTDVAYNYKAVLVDSERNLIGFSAYGEQMHYYLYSYDSEKGFTCLMDKVFGGYVNDLRGLYVGDTLYLAEGNAVESFSLETFEKIDDLVL
ncbi:MAG: hypothetical protein HFH53_08580 [Hespellia sp.]|jgi:inhibitor of cysteine peptidase|nr:hypothetical protein [Hespellia sp.]